MCGARVSCDCPTPPSLYLQLNAVAHCHKRGIFHRSVPARATAGTLRAAHESGVRACLLHTQPSSPCRDIKPENILLSSVVDVHEGLKLADFGSCRGIFSKQPYVSAAPPSLGHACEMDHLLRVGVCRRSTSPHAGTARPNACSPMGTMDLRW